MSTTTVTTQADLDTALAAHKDDPGATIIIDSPRGERLHLGDSGSATVRAYDSATVRAYGSATVEASGSATVRAYDSATVRAYGSATVEASGSATVRVYGSATVEAYGSATVWAYGSATVEASGSATVRAYDSATVEASGSATVRAYDSATVEASKYVAVHLHSARATITGGVIIDLTQVDLTDPAAWAEYTGAEVQDGQAILYKAVDDQYAAGHVHTLTVYPVGGTVTAPDWRDDHECGHGLHTSPHPHQALAYYQDAKRMLRVTVPLADLRPIPGGTAKAKARTLTVLDEVALDGSPLAVTA